MPEGMAVQGAPRRGRNGEPPPQDSARGMAEAGRFCAGVDRKTFRGWVRESAYLREHMRVIRGVPYWKYAVLARFMDGRNTPAAAKETFFRGRQTTVINRQ